MKKKKYLARDRHFQKKKIVQLTCVCVCVGSHSFSNENETTKNDCEIIIDHQREK